MCLYPKLIFNRKYLPSAKNGGNPPQLVNEKVKYVPIGCGWCIECRKKKANEWRLRLSIENANNTNGIFVTFTISDEYFEELIEAAGGSVEPADIAKIAVRRFCERWRKKFKKSIKHFFVSELGENTSRLHLHGIIFTAEEKETIRNIWKYGHIFCGYCNQNTINYVTKYILKFDAKHADFKPTILVSPGLGKAYISEDNKIIHKFRNEKTKEHTDICGHKIGLPIYYRNYFFNEDEREKLWLNRIEKCERYILGTKYSTKNLEEIKYFYKCLATAQEYNDSLGYKNYGEEWKKEYYRSVNQIVNKFK